MFDTWINVFMNEIWTYEWMNVTKIVHLSNKFVLQMCFQYTILVRETYELCLNKFYTISITKSWNVKFMMEVA
jgi:hypothetical protein